MAPAAGPIVGNDLRERSGERTRVGGLALADGHSAGTLVVVAGGDDSLGVRENCAVVEEDVDVVLRCKLTARRCCPCSMKYGRLVRLIVSETIGSAVWTRSRTSRQATCCQSGKVSM